MWPIIVPLIMLAIGLTLKIAELMHSNKLANDEISALRKKIDSLNDEHEKQITGLKEIQKAESEKFRNKFIEISHNATPPKTNNIIVLPVEQLKILQLLFTRDDFEFDTIVSNLSFKDQTARYHLEELKNQKMVSQSSRRNRHEGWFREYWRIEQPGRKYLHDAEVKECEQNPHKTLPSLEEFVFQPEGFYTHPNFNHEICPKCLHQEPMKVVPVTNASGPWKCVSCDYKVSPKAACVSSPPEPTRRGGFVNSWRKYV